MEGQISRWGNSLGIRIPSDIARKVGFVDGAKVEIEAHGTEVVIKRVEPRLRYTLDELMAGFTPALRAELNEAATDVEFGPDVGREIIEK